MTHDSTTVAFAATTGPTASTAEAPRRRTGGRDVAAERQRVVSAATAALLDLTATDVLSAVGVRELARRSHVSTPTLYRLFGSLEGLAEAVVAHVFDPDRGVADQGVQAAGELTSSPLPVEVGLALHRSEFDRLRSDEELRLRMGLWGLGGEATAVAYRDMLRDTEARIAEQLPEMLEAWGREVRLPFDLTSFLALHVSFLNGCTVRSLVDPGVLDREGFARAALALTRVLLRIEGDRRTIDDRLAEINYFPLRDARGKRLTDRSRLTRARILDAAAELFGQVDVADLSLADVAKQAQVSRSTVYALFEDVHDVAAQLSVSQAADVLAEHAPRRRDEESDELDAVLSLLVAIVRRRLPHAGSYAARLASVRAVPSDAVVDLVLRVMAEPDVDVAQTAVLVLVRQAVRRPSDPERAKALARAVLEH